MASLDSAKGPSVTVRPFLPETILPSRLSGWLILTFPCWVNRSNQVVHWPMIFWISSGERSLSQCVPRNNNRYSDVVVVLISALFMLVCVAVQFYDERESAPRTTCVMVGFSLHRAGAH